MSAKPTPPKEKKTWKGEPQLIRSLNAIDLPTLMTEKGCYGQVVSSNPTNAGFVIDPRQPVEEYMDTCIHETLHILCPSWSEAAVKHASEIISALLWKGGYRRIHMDTEDTVKVLKQVKKNQKKTKS